MKSIFITKLKPIKIPFIIQKLTIFYMLILIYELEYEYNTKQTSFGNHKD